MKRILMVLVLVGIIATGTAFADHPDGLGIGIVGNLNIYDHNNSAISVTLSGIGLSLKIPDVPIYWGFFFRGLGDDNYFGGGVTGDFYFIDDHIDGPWHWYFGLGFFANLDIHSVSVGNTKYTHTQTNGGLRVPVGISIQPMEWFEVFIQAVPSFGVHITGKQDHGIIVIESETSFFWGVPVELGIRFWL